MVWVRPRRHHGVGATAHQQFMPLRIDQTEFDIGFTNVENGKYIDHETLSCQQGSYFSPDETSATARTTADWHLPPFPSDPPSHATSAASADVATRPPCHGRPDDAARQTICRCLTREKCCNR